MKSTSFVKKTLSFFILFPLAFVARILKYIGNFFLILSSYLIYIRSGNIYLKNFKTDLILKKSIKFKNHRIYVRVNNFWDYWRSKHFESYPIDIILKDLEKYSKQNKKIVYYEIGANVGYSTIFVSKIIENFGEAFAFEIDSTNFKTLNDNIILNKSKNLVPLNIGISSENKVEKFYFNTKFTNNKYHLPSSSMGMHSIKFDKNVHNKNIYCLTPLMKFNEILKIFGLPKPTHLFIDAYGAEKKIIDSIILNDPNLHPDVIMVDIEEEIHSLKDSKIVKTLESNNYVLNHSILEKGSKEIPDSYKTIFRKK